MDAAMVAWCRRWLDAEPVAVLFRAGYLSEVTGLRLGGGGEGPAADVAERAALAGLDVAGVA